MVFQEYLKVPSYAKCTFLCLLYINICPRCVRKLTVLENKTLSLFLRTQISKDGGTTGLIQICIRYDVISEMWAGFTPTALSEMSLAETMRDVIWT